ncbi:N-terminal nucleophile aminohydrolase [Fomitiporia mediterranea MF3/22]|uniref:N-terminal nucleophile aminohydrolase n=1 Tax=Fomitiporia mediterranea (strain MF3/22) TaxID=694068 RepID=UPI0004407D0F|nr:N-terminal nucleophile aminohydrolase [Fomitiporia mediterranea MF3/22]EJD00517.1 N-terminal nucleophile aminohydrolase [Fomitiporia mediterranea MF3/22]
MSDFQYIQQTLDDLLIEEETTKDDGHKLGPAEIHEYLSQVMYRRRSKFDPLWNAILVGGFKDGQRFLAYVDLLGVTYSASTIATGFGAHIALPLMRSAVEGREDTLTEDDARALLEQCMKVLFYRDARSLNKYQIATITADGPRISESKSAQTEWAFAEGIRGYGAQTQ